jgi:cytochrome P450
MTTNGTHAPGPPGIFGVRNLLRFMGDQLELLRELQDTHGDIVEMRVLGKPWFLISHPDDIESVFVKHARVMGRDDYVVVLQRALGVGLLTSDGDLWKRQRKLMSQAFTPKRIKGYGEAMVDVTDRGTRGFANGQEINLHAEMSRVTMEVVAAVLFGGASVDAHTVNEVREAMEVINEFFANSPEAVLKLPRWAWTPRNARMNHAVGRIDRVLFDIIARGRKNSGEKNGGGEKHDLLGILLEAQDDEGLRMSDQQLRDEAVTLFLAGHETTALALAHTLYLLSKHPSVERKLHAEIQSVLGDRLPTADDVRKLVYTDQVLKESMRLYPPAWTTGRETLEDIELSGYKIPKGAQLLLSQWVVHRDPRWFPNPEGFDPDRWEPSKTASLSKYAYFPFGGGPRVCIGNHFAMMEAALILVTLLQRYRFELLPGQRLDLKPSVTLRQAGPGLRMRIFDRAAQAPAVKPAAAVAV